MRIPGKARRTPVVHLDDKVSTLSASQEKTEEDLPMDLCFLPSKNTAEEEEEEEEEEEHIELQKGDHVQAQQDVYLWLLELRTHVQTLIDLSHRLPLPNEWEPSWTSMSAWTNTQVEVNALVQAFHQLLHRFLGPTLTSPSLLDPPTFSSSKSLLETLISHVQSTQSNRWTTLDDWYQKSNLTLTPTLLSTQVIHLTNHPRSLSKTQVNRAQVIPFSHSIPPEHHVEVYDDMDFYTVLLKDLLQLRSQTHPHPLNPHEAHRSFSSSSQVKLKIDSTAMQMKKKKRIIPRTTKGRKVRYEVHSKLQNFMTPQVSTSSSSSSSSGKWTETRIQEVFSTLFGRKSSLPALSNLSESFSPSMGFNSVPLFSTMEQEENERFPLFAIQ